MIKRNRYALESAPPGPGSRANPCITLFTFQAASQNRQLSHSSRSEGGGDDSDLG